MKISWKNIEGELHQLFHWGNILWMIKTSFYLFFLHFDVSSLEVLILPHLLFFFNCLHWCKWFIWPVLLWRYRTEIIQPILQIKARCPLLDSPLGVPTIKGLSSCHVMFFLIKCDFHYHPLIQKVSCHVMFFYWI